MKAEPTVPVALYAYVGPPFNIPFSCLLLSIDFYLVLYFALFTLTVVTNYSTLTYPLGPLGAGEYHMVNAML